MVERLQRTSRALFLLLLLLEIFGTSLLTWVRSHGRCCEPFSWPLSLLIKDLFLLSSFLLSTDLCFCFCFFFFLRFSLLRSHGRCGGACSCFFFFWVWKSDRGGAGSGFYKCGAGRVREKWIESRGGVGFGDTRPVAIPTKNCLKRTRR